MGNEPDQDVDLDEVKTPICSPYLICDNCGAYPLMPVHGHYVCPECKMPTKCCEGGPQET